MDIKFYDFNFNLLAVLPRSNGNNAGYTFLNYKPEFLGHGSFEMTYISEKIDRIAEECKDGLFVVLDDFQGYLTGYRFQGDKHKLYGKHLNGLLSRRLIEPQSNSKDTSGNIVQKEFEAYARELIQSKYDFLELGAEKGFTDKITHETTEYTAGDEFFKTLFEKVGAGYGITADFVQKKLIFNILKKRETTLMLSENNLNAYDFDIAYDNKEIVTHGIYSEKQPDTIQKNEDGDRVVIKNPNIIKTIGDASGGIYKIETWLSSETEAEAQAELKSKKPMFDITASTRRIRWNYDYALGDIVRVQKDGITVMKTITSVSVSVEGSRIETPTLTDYEVTKND